MARRSGRTQECGVRDARERLRSRSDDHKDAAKLIAEIEPDGRKAAAAVRQLIGLKDSAHYGFLSVSGRELKQSVRQASYLAEFAERVILRSG
jgi:hypothetical protein